MPYKDKEKAKQYQKLYRTTHNNEIKEYRKSDNFKEAKKKYTQSEKGKKTQQNYCLKYEQTPQRKAYVKLYNQTTERKASLQKRGKSLERKIYMKVYNKNHKDERNEKVLERYHNIEIIEHVDKAQLISQYNSKCVYCGTELINDCKTHIDHLIPVIRYKKIGKKAPHKYSTVVPACEHCNTSKSSKTPLEFIWQTN